MSLRDLTCYRCGTAFTAHRFSRLCRDCYLERKRELRAERDKQAKELQEIMAEMTPTTIPSLSTCRKELYRAGIELTRDRQPEGWLSRWGSNDGESTRDASVRAALVASRARLRTDEEAQAWYAANPHWAVGIPGSETLAAAKPSNGLACGDARGTRKGWRRHQNDHEMPCPECQQANAEYMRDYRASRNPTY